MPRPAVLLEIIEAHERGAVSDEALERAYDEATQDSLAQLEQTGSEVLTDGEQRKFQNFWTYAVHGHPKLAPGGFELQFLDHVRRFPQLVSGPFRYMRHASEFLERARERTTLPLKQAVIAPSAMSLLYPAQELPGYSREAFIADVLDEHEREVRACLALGAHRVQLDFTEARVAVKLDPSGSLLERFIQLNNLALRRFSEEDRARIGVHTCPGGDLDSTHSADVDYAELIPSLFTLQAGSFFMELAHERDRRRVLELVRDHVQPGQRVFVGVIDVLDPRIETPEMVRDRVLEAAEYIPLDQLGTTDDCGFSPFSDDRSTTRETAFAKIRARIVGTAMASEALGLGDG